MSCAIKDIWNELEAENCDVINYRSLGDNISELRAAYDPSNKSNSILIEVPIDYKIPTDAPKWRGMTFCIKKIKLGPHQHGTHLSISLAADKHQQIFEIVCTDIVKVCERISNTDERISNLESCILKWDSFFNNSDVGGLSKERQQGLFAELYWMNFTLNGNLNNRMVINSWKGGKRGLHDFDFMGCKLEVKSSAQKELVQISISNELQLDDRPLSALHLYVLLLLPGEDRSKFNLVSLIEEIRGKLDPTESSAFDDKLIGYGYHEIDKSHYDGIYYAIRKELLHEVKEGFPRLIDLPEHVSQVSYKLSLSACSDYLIEDKSKYLEMLNKVESDG